MGGAPTAKPPGMGYLRNVRAGVPTEPRWNSSVGNNCGSIRRRKVSRISRSSTLLARDPQDVKSTMPWARPQQWLWDAAIHPGAGASA